MYKSFYSLAKAPFSKDMGSKDTFRSTGYQEALNGLEYLHKSKGIGLMIGDPGVGKTFTLRSFKNSLNPALYHVVYFPLSTGGVMDFYRGLACISKMLNAEIDKEGVPSKGVPQGGILSTLLSNVVLNDLDQWVAGQWEFFPLSKNYKSQRGIPCPLCG